MGLYATCKNTESIFIPPPKKKNKMRIKKYVHKDMHILRAKQGPYTFFILICYSYSWIRKSE